MSTERFSYLGKFVFEEGASPGLNILVIREFGEVRFVGEGVDHAGHADTPAGWKSQLSTLLPALGIQARALSYVEPFT
ncbi:MAG: hypothetical protein QF467_07040 [SAR202 cluster bacterium]|jgi:hypothetical protein|nr:hypothetical protein [SAR202 cluster bacterium]